MGPFPSPGSGERHQDEEGRGNPEHREHPSLSISGGEGSVMAARSPSSSEDPLIVSRANTNTVTSAAASQCSMRRPPATRPPERTGTVKRSEIEICPRPTTLRRNRE